MTVPPPRRPPNETSHTPGRFFSPLACSLMFGAPAGAICGLAVIGAGERVSDTADAFYVLCGVAALAVSAVGGAAGWAVAARRRWDSDPAGVFGYAIIGAFAGAATFIAASVALGL